MAYRCSGLIEIPLSEFWEFVAKYHQNNGVEVRYGVPRCNIGGQTIEIEFVADSDTTPESWAQPPKFLDDWTESTAAK